VTTNQRENQYHALCAHLGLVGGVTSVKFKCPIHGDKKASGTASLGKDGRVLITCHVGCRIEDILEAWGFSMRDLFPEDRQPEPKQKYSPIVSTYPYTNKEGILFYEKVRRADKSFTQRRKDSSGGWIYNRQGIPPVLYNLPEVSKSEIVVICEGEKDADALMATGFTATTGENGAGKGKWKPEYTDQLTGKHVLILGDNDTVGRDYQAEIANALHGKAATVKVLDLAKIWPEIPEHGDISDYIEAMGLEEALSKLADLIHDTPEWEPVITQNSQTEEWKPPISLGDVVLPEFPAQCLPDAMRDYVLAVSEAMQVSVDMSAVAALVVTAICIQKKLVIKGKADWYEPLNLYATIVALPAERKSALLQAMTKVLFEYERDINEQLKDAIAEYQIRKNILEKTVRELEDKAAKGKGAVTAEDVIETRKELEELKEIKPMRLLADDVSPEALTTLLAEQNGKMAVVSAEGGIFEILNGRYSQSVNIDTFLKAHASDPVRVDRRGRPSEYIPHPALSVLLAIQPVVLDGLMGNDAFRGRGLTARFLYSIPTSKVGRRSFETPPISPVSESKYRGMIYSLLAIQQEDKPRIIELSSDAYRLSADFATELEPKLSGDLETMGDWAGKFHGAILRIAGILHASQHSQNCTDIELSAKTMQDAITIGRYFLEHAKAAYTLMGADQQIQQAKYVLRQLEKQHYERIARRDLFRMCRGRFKKTEDINPALELLTEYGYITESEVERKGVGRKPDTQYKVNPFLYGQNGLNGQNC
jgi:5S rRNA maturation endonuclease (ribonuclease M5)